MLGSEYFLKNSGSETHCENRRKITLVLAALMERLNPEFCEDWQTKYENIDHYLTLISSKIVKILR